MAYLVRKISRSRFHKITHTENIQDIDADIVSNDLRTSKNCLSTWKADTTEDIENAILAIASTSDHLETMSFLLFDEAQLAEKELDFEGERDSSCPVEDLANLHTNIRSLSYKKIGDVLCIVKQLPNTRVILRTKQEISTMITNAKENGRLNVLLLKEDVMKYISPIDYSRLYPKEK